MNTNDTVKLLRELREFLSGAYFQGPVDEFRSADFIKNIDAALAPVATIQPAGGKSVAKPASIACSACYGSGYGIDGKPCPCGCRPAASAPAQPEAKGDYLPFNPDDINPDGNFGDTVDFAAIVAASLTAPVPAAPADKGELPVVAWLIDSYDRLDKLHQTVELSPLTDELDESAEAVALCTVEAAQAALARQLPRIRHLEHERDLARQAAIAQPSGDDNDVCPHRYAFNPEEQHAECELCGQAFQDTAAAPQPPSTGSIADDAEFLRLLEIHADDDQGRMRTVREISDFIDTRTAALIDAASKERGGDAERLEFMMEREAWIAWSKDGESCRLFHRDEDGEPMPMLGWGARHWSHDPREAIDAAIATTKAAI